MVWQKLGLGEIGAVNLGLAALALASITAGTLYQKRFVAPCDVRSASLVQLTAAFVVTLPLALLEAEGMRWTGELAGAIREGRAREFAWVAAEDGPPSFPNGLPDATAESTYRSALLRWGEIAAPEHAAVLDRYRELIALRRSLPHVFGADAPCVIDQEGAVITMRRGGSAGDRGEGPGVATVVCDLDARG